MQNPFKKSEEIKERLKLFLYGDTGTGKTFLSLQFPNPVVIDLEKGTAAYGKTFNFEVLQATSLREIQEALNFLSTEKHEYKTLVIDPITMMYELLQDKWMNIFLERNKKSAGNKQDFYIFQPSDWKTIKDDWKNFIRKILALDMNIICIARQKPLYADGEFMKVIGDTYDVDRATAYYFDTVIQLKRAGEKRLACVIKDRNNKIGVNTFECQYSVFEKAYPGLNFESVPVVRMVTKEQLSEIGKLMKEMEYTALMMQGYTQEHIGRVCLSKDLKEFEADKIIQELRAEKEFNKGLTKMKEREQLQGIVCSGNITEDLTNFTITELQQEIRNLANVLRFTELELGTIYLDMFGKNCETTDLTKNEAIAIIWKLKENINQEVAA